EDDRFLAPGPHLPDRVAARVRDRGLLLRRRVEPQGSGCAGHRPRAVSVPFCVVPSAGFEPATLRLGGEGTTAGEWPCMQRAGDLRSTCAVTRPWSEAG